MENQLPEFAILICGGKGIRTPDLLIANETLYQLSYTPVYLSTKCTKGAYVQAALIRIATSETARNSPPALALMGEGGRETIIW